MAITVQTLEDVEGLLQQQIIPYQALSSRDPRTMRVRDLLMRLLGNAIGEKLSKSQMELVDIGFSALVESEMIPGLSSGSQNYNQVLNSILSINGPRGGSSYKDQQTLQQLANLAYNTTSYINDLMYNQDGTMDFSVTKGLDSKLATGLSAGLLKRQIQGQKLETIADTLSFGRSAQQMRENLDTYVAKGSIEGDSELRKRLSQQIKEIEALENEAVTRFAYRMPQQQSVVVLDSENKPVYVDDPNTGQKVQKTEQVVQKVNPGFQIEVGGKTIQSEAEFANLSDYHRRQAAQQYYQKLIDLSVKNQGEIKDDQGRVVDYQLFDEQGNKLQTVESKYVDGKRVDTARDIKMSDIMTNFLDSTEAKQAIKYGTEIFGRVVSQTSANAFREMLQNGDTNEVVLKQEVREKMLKDMNLMSENVRFVSKVFGINDINQVQAVAEATGLGDILDTSSSSKVRNQLQELKRMAISQNRSIKDLFKERADLIEVLGVEYGGAQYVSPEFASNLHRIISKYNVENQRTGGTPLKTQDEVAQEVIRSRANAENVFGGFAVAEYALNHFDYISEDGKEKMQDLLTKGRELLKNGDREGARAISDKLNVMVEQAAGGRLSYAHNRRAQQLYGNTDYELSVESGLKEQLAYNYEKQFATGYLNYSDKQSYFMNSNREIAKLKDSEAYKRYEAADNKEELLNSDAEVKQVVDKIKNFSEEVSKFKKDEQQLLKDVISITGSEDSEIQKLTSSYQKYLNIVNGNESYAGKTGQEAADNWLRNVYAEGLRVSGYSEAMSDTNIEVIKRMQTMGVDPSKFGSYLTTMVNNTGTRFLGQSDQADKWLEKFTELTTPGNKSLDMSTEELIIAGLIGDGSNYMDEQESFSISYRKWLQRTNQKESKETLEAYFKDKAKDGGAKLGAYAVETFQQNGSFGSDEDIDKFLRDNYGAEAAEAYKKQDAEGKAKFLENGKFKDGPYKGLTVRQAYNKSIAEAILKDEDAQAFLKQIKVDPNNAQQREEFIETLKTQGMQGLYKKYLQPNGMELATTGKHQFVIDRAAYHQNSLEVNQELSSLTKANFSKYLKDDSTIDKYEYMELLADAYGLDMPELKELLEKSGEIDKDGNFAAGNGIFSKADLNTMEKASQWFKSKKLPDKEAINKAFDDPDAYNKLLKGQYASIKGYDEKTGTFKHENELYNGKTPEEILSSKLTTDHKRALIDSAYKKGTYDLLTSTSLSEEDSKKKNALVDGNGVFRDGQFAGRTMQTVLAQFARGELEEQQFVKLLMSETQFSPDLQHVKDSLEAKGILSDGKFVSGIMPGKSLEEGLQWLNEVQANGKTRAEQFREVQQSQDKSMGGAEKAVSDILNNTAAIKQLLTSIDENTKTTKPTGDAKVHQPQQAATSQIQKQE